jgi:hypothetical protein
VEQIGHRLCSFNSQCQSAPKFDAVLPHMRMLPGGTIGAGDPTAVGGMHLKALAVRSARGLWTGQVRDSPSPALPVGNPYFFRALRYRSISRSGIFHSSLTVIRPVSPLRV